MQQAKEGIPGGFPASQQHGLSGTTSPLAVGKAHLQLGIHHSEASKTRVIKDSNVVPYTYGDREEKKFFTKVVSLCYFILSVLLGTQI